MSIMCVAMALFLHLVYFGMNEHWQRPVADIFVIMQMQDMHSCVTHSSSAAGRTQNWEVI